MQTIIIFSEEKKLFSISVDNCCNVEKENNRKKWNIHVRRTKPLRNETIYRHDIIIVSKPIPVTSCGNETARLDFENVN